jgi:nickel-dependent lactate racemase
MIPYGDASLPLPAAPFLLDVVDPAPSAAAAGPAEIAAALERPRGSPPAREVFRGARRVLVVVSDGTRATGLREVAPALVEAIRAASAAEITFAVASGIHARPTESEVRRILGEDVAARHAVLLHDPDDSAGLVDLGRTRKGTRVIVSRALRAHDRIVLTGAVGFHYTAGFSGGRKAVVPGLASRETVSRNHLRAIDARGGRHPGARAGSLADNPVHRDMAEGAAMVGAHFLVNTVVGAGGRVQGVFAGDVRDAHLAACRHVRATRRVRLAPRDLVVASAGGDPADVDLVQSHKAFEAAAAALRPGGVFVLVARCGKGAGSADFLDAFDLSGEREMVRALLGDFRVYAQTALSWHRKAKRLRLILVSDLPDPVARKVGAEPARDLDQALALAAGHLPPGTRGWVLPRAPKILVEAASP